jgi:hypothetical protein
MVHPLHQTLLRHRKPLRGRVDLRLESFWASASFSEMAWALTISAL